VLDISLQEILFLLLAALVFARNPLNALLINDIFKLLTVEAKPIKVLVVFDSLGSAAGQIVALAATLIRENGICEGDFLEFLVCSGLVGFGRLICRRLEKDPSSMKEVTDQDGV
jgi:hypothetical protein